MATSPQRLTASRLGPPMERCPDCGQPAVLRHKGRRLVRCAACSLAAVRMRKRAYQVAHRAERQERRRNGGVPCPPYEAWDVEAMRHGEDEAWTCVVYGPRGHAWPEALVTFGPLIAATPLASWARVRVGRPAASTWWWRAWRSRPREGMMSDESKSAADFHADGVLGSLYHIVVEVAGSLDVLAVAINYAEGSNPEACAQIREDWDGIMARMGRIEQLLAALPMPERGADDDA